MAANDVAVQGIIFHPDGGFDISYAEQRDIRQNGTTLKTHMVPPGVLGVEVDEVRDAIRELLDLALDKAQDAPDRISRR